MPETAPAQPSHSLYRAARHHWVIVVVAVLLGALAGYLYAASTPTTYASTARVLINPTAGNPFVPTPSSVRQDEVTSLETEAQVARSEEVLAVVVAQVPTVSTTVLKNRLQITVPPNTQILEISYTASDPVVAQTVANAVADAYLANRAQRSEGVNQARIERIEARTQTVVADLRDATEAAQTDNDAERLFQQQLADALRNELVSLRSQRTALESSEAPPGNVIAPATEGSGSAGLTALVMPVGGALAGLALACLLVSLFERFRGVVRSSSEVEDRGIPVLAAAAAPLWRESIRRRGRFGALDTAVRRLRATMLDLEPRPSIVTVAPAGTGPSDGPTSETVAESFAKAGLPVVLVRTDSSAMRDGIEPDTRGLAQALTYERLDVLGLLQPTGDPLLCLLSDGGFDGESLELVAADRVRSVLGPLVDSGNIVVIQSPGTDSPEGEAFLGAADLGLVVVTTGRTRARALGQVASLVRAGRSQVAALVIGRHDGDRGRQPLQGSGTSGSRQRDSAARQQVTRAPR